MRYKKEFAFLIIAGIAITACGSSPTSPSEIPQLPTPSPTPIPETVTYTDLDALFEARLESGAWTEEEGLIAMLELIAGKTTGEDFLAGAQVTTQAATGMLLQAQSYLENGQSEATKAEIQSLLNALVPSQATLDLYSQRAESKARRAPGLAKQIDCRTLQAEGFPEDSATTCFLTHELTIGVHTVKVYFPEGWGDDAMRMSYLTETEQAITDSVRAYTGLGLTHKNLTVFFTLLDYSPTGRATDLWYAASGLARDSDPESDCLAAIYPAGTSAGSSRGMGVYKQILAHELFHCYQFWNWNEAARVPPTENKWWMEGTAEYFGNTVYPIANAEYEYIPGFDRQSPSRSLLGMDYENFIFFQYLANEIGDEGVLRLIGSMPTAPGASQADALSAFPEIEDLFQNFGRAYLDGQIMDTGGGAIPVSPQFRDLISFDETFRDAIPPVDRFILRRFKLTFPEERHYEVEVGSEGAEGRNGVSFGVGGEWVPLESSEFDVGCGTQEWELLVTTSAAEGPYHVILDVTVEEGPTCDECLIGLWELDNASYEAYWNATPAGANENVEYGGVSGTMYAIYDEDGFVTNGWSDFTINYTQSFGGTPPDQDFAIILNGVGTARYSVFGESLTYSESLSDYIIVVTMGGSVVASTGITPDAFGGDFSGTPIRYVCTDEMLQFISAEFPQLNELVYRRGD
ncbi:MAG: hypothetical protein WD751_07000 [Anaerolineales bacterium]